jgi:hypothetical protein
MKASKGLVALGLISSLIYPGTAYAARGMVTNMGSANVPYRYAATHHGDNQLTFKDNSVLRLTRRSHTLIVKVTDVCDGSGCRMLDISLAGFKHLGFSATQGVGRVNVGCGRGGHVPMRKCLAGEDK